MPTAFLHTGHRLPQRRLFPRKCDVGLPYGTGGAFLSCCFSLVFPLCAAFSILHTPSLHDCVCDSFFSVHDSLSSRLIAASRHLFNSALAFMTHCVQRMWSFWAWANVVTRARENVARTILIYMPGLLIDVDRSFRCISLETVGLMRLG